MTLNESDGGTRQNDDASRDVDGSGSATSKRSLRVVDDEGPGLPQMQFFTVAEVASVMRVSRMTVYRLVHSGELPAVRVGRSFRVPRSAVHDYLQAAFTDAG